MIYNKMIASIVSCNLTSIKWTQSIRSSHLNYIITTHYSLTVSFMIAYINVLFIIGIKLTDLNKGLRYYVMYTNCSGGVY